MHPDHAGHRPERLEHRPGQPGLRAARREEAGQLQLCILRQVVAEAVAEGRPLFRPEARLNAAPRQMRREDDGRRRSRVGQGGENGGGLGPIAEHNHGQAGRTSPFPHGGRGQHLSSTSRIRGQPGMGRSHIKIKVGRFHRHRTGVAQISQLDRAHPLHRGPGTADQRRVQHSPASQGIHQGGQFDAGLPEHRNAGRPLTEENFFDRIQLAQDGFLQ